MSADSKSAVFKYLHDQNRPYSVNDIMLNLHKEHGKTAIQKGLDLLVIEGKIIEKVNGKQKAYVVNQLEMPTATPNELAALDQQVSEFQGQLKVLTDQLRCKENALKSLSSQLTTEEAEKEKSIIQEEVSKLEKRLSSLKSQGHVVSKADKVKVEKQHEASVKEWRKRKRMCLNIIDAILESYPKSKKVLLEEIGIETDEAVGAKMPDL